MTASVARDVAINVLGCSLRTGAPASSTPSASVTALNAIEQTPAWLVRMVKWVSARLGALSLLQGQTDGLTHGVCSVKFPHRVTGIIGVLIRNECDSLGAVCAIVEKANALNRTDSAEQALLEINTEPGCDVMQALTWRSFSVRS